MLLPLELQFISSVNQYAGSHELNLAKWKYKLLITSRNSPINYNILTEKTYYE